MTDKGDRYSVIVSQGRVADREIGLRHGAVLSGEKLSHYLGSSPLVVGDPSEPAVNDWSVDLPQARETLAALQSAVRAVFDSSSGSSSGSRTIPLLTLSTCAASLASLPLLAQQHPDAVVLWVDAHSDFNTPETTQSGYLGGMVLAAACGLWDSGYGSGIDPRNVVIVGGRDIDPAERTLLHDHGVTLLPPAQSTPERVRELIGDRPVWVHTDWDVLEPGYIPAAYRVPDGLLPHQVAAIFAAIPAERLCGVEFTEFIPGGSNTPERLSVELLLETFQHLMSS